MTTEPSFATGILCFDGRIQTPVIEHLRSLFQAPHVDHITRPGAVRLLSGQLDHLTEDLLADVAFSLDRHRSTQIAVVAHHDCAGNPETDTRQKGQLREAERLLTARFASAEVIALFFDPALGFERIT